MDYSHLIIFKSLYLSGCKYPGSKKSIWQIQESPYTLFLLAMEKCRPFCLLLLSCLAFSVLACKNNNKRTSQDLASLNLTRGEFLLCGTGNFGKANNNLSCDAASRETFDMAMALLHSFEYTEAEKAFVKVIDMNPDCAMAYWGVAMCNFHPLWAPPGKEELEKGSGILEVARDLKPSGQVGDYLGAIMAFYEDWEHTDHATRTGRFEAKMAALYNKYPEDKEAAVFYALALNAAADPSDKSYARQRKAGALLESLFPQQPEHPGIAHYIIHNYDYPELAGLALPTARKYAQIAPSSAHAQHMPSHIFTRLGLWEEAIQSNLKSTASAKCYAESIATDAHWDEELHGMDYLVYAYLQLGDTENAKKQYRYMESFKKIFPVNFKVAYTAAAIPSRLALEIRDWEAAAALALPLADQIPWESYPWQKAILYSAKSLGAIRSGSPERAEEGILALKAIHSQLREKGENYAALQVNIQLTTLEAWMALAQGDNAEAISRMQLATNMEAGTTKHPVTPGEVLPAGELLGDMFLELNQPIEALAAYEADMKSHPNRFNGLFGAGMAAIQCGLDTKAHDYFNRLIKNSAPESSRIELAIAREFITKYTG